MIRIVPDTNILISAVISHGNEFEVLKLGKLGKIQIILSPEILKEFEGVISREKFGFSKEQIANAINQIKDIAEIVHPKIKLKVVKDDPSDDKILECAVWGKADYLVTGDRKHLLKIKKFRGVKLVSSGEFLRKF